MKLCPKPLKIEGENNQRISKSIRSGKLMKTKTENKKLDKTNMKIPELKREFPSKGIPLRESSTGNPP
jgi:hypothetical protein